MDRNGTIENFAYQSSVWAMGREIRIRMYETPNGLCILLEGGDQGHIGAIAFSSRDTKPQSFSFPGHKEAIVCERWLEKTRRIYQGPVVVLAGIHYDNITKEQIRHILELLDKELDTFLAYLENSSSHPP